MAQIKPGAIAKKYKRETSQVNSTSMHHPCSSLSFLRKTKPKTCYREVSFIRFTSALFTKTELLTIIFNASAICWLFTHFSTAAICYQLHLPPSQPKRSWARRPRTALWLKPRDLHIFILVFDSAGPGLLFETISTLVSFPLLPLHFFPVSFVVFLLFFPSQSFCLQPTCILLVRCSRSPPLPRTKVGSPGS